MEKDRLDDLVDRQIACERTLNDLDKSLDDRLEKLRIGVVAGIKEELAPIRKVLWGDGDLAGGLVARVAMQWRVMAWVAGVLGSVLSGIVVWATIRK